MESLRQALREMKDFTIVCGKMDAEEPQEHVYIQWVDDDKNFNKGYAQQYSCDIFSISLSSFILIEEGAGSYDCLLTVCYYSQKEVILSSQGSWLT